MHGMTIRFDDADTITTSCKAIMDGKETPDHPEAREVRACLGQLKSPTATALVRQQSAKRTSARFGAVGSP